MKSRLPRENDMPNGERVQAMIPGKILRVSLTEGNVWGTNAISPAPAWIQIHVDGNHVRLLDFEDVLENGGTVDGTTGFFPLVNGGVYTFGLPQADADESTPGVQQPSLLFYSVSGPATLHIICAGA